MAPQYEKSPLSLAWHTPSSNIGPRPTVPAPTTQDDEGLLTEVTGQVLSGHEAQGPEEVEEEEVGEEEEGEEVVVPATADVVAAALGEDDDDEEEEEDVLRVGEGEDEENVPTAIEDHEVRWSRSWWIPT